MKKIYQIPKSQLIVIIIFGIIGELITIGTLSDSYDSSNFLGFLAVFIPFLVIFYCVGWKYYNKENILSPKQKDHMLGTYLSSKINNSQFCIKCGEKNTLDSKYCIGCGDLLVNK